MSKNFDSFCKNCWSEIEHINALVTDYKVLAREIIGCVVVDNSFIEKIQNIVKNSLYSSKWKAEIMFSKRVDIKPQDAINLNACHISQILNDPQEAQRCLNSSVNEVTWAIDRYRKTLNTKCEKIIEFDKEVTSSNIRLWKAFEEFTGKKVFSYDELPLRIYFKNVKNKFTKDYPNVDFNDISVEGLSNLIKQDINVVMDVNNIRNYYRHFPLGNCAPCKYETYESFYNFMVRLFEVNEICSKDELNKIIELGNMFSTETTETRKELLNKLVIEYSKGFLKCDNIDNISYFIMKKSEKCLIDSSAPDNLIKYFKQVA